MHFERLEPHHHKQVIALAVMPEQRPFVGTTVELLAKQVSSSHLHVIIATDRVIGLFNIDTAYADQYDFASAQELGLRSFLIDSKMQGKGYGQQAVANLQPFLQANYAAFSAIVLTVNCKNPSAYHCYKRNGFHDTGLLYLGGKAGPQHIMRMPIR